MDDLGGEENVAATKRALIDACVGTWLILSSLDRYIFSAKNAIVNTQSRKVYTCIGDRMRIADSLTRQLSAVGLTKRDRAALTIREYVESKEESEAAPADRDPG